MAEAGAGWTTPAPISPEHDTSLFRCGEASLDEWLRKRALANMTLAASRTYVVCLAGEQRVVGYYALSMGQVANADTIGSMRRNMPANIPSVVIGRLAVDMVVQGKGLGPLLLADAVRRSRKASDYVSARLVIVHAISAQAEAFYRRHGFTKLPVDAPTYALDLVKFDAFR